MPPKRTSKGKDKVVSDSGTGHSRDREGGFRRFLTSVASTRHADIISRWALLGERLVRLDDFPGFEIVTLVDNCVWQKVVERPHPVYDGLV